MQSKLPFRTAYSGQIRKPTAVGQQTANIYEYIIDNYGRKILQKTGETNVYEKIQENLEETKIENILARASMGDNSVFRPEGIYADTTEMPSNLIEARQAMQNLENTWNGLPNDIKRKYNFNVEEFIGASGSQTWLEDMGLITKEVPHETPAVEPKAETKEVKGEPVNE